MNIIIGENFRDFTEPGSMGVVKDTRYVRCYWPKLDKPVALFAEGSSGIEVQGPPTPRNVVFPDGVVFLPITVNDGDWNNPNWRETDIPTKRDCFFIREKVEEEVLEKVDEAREIEVDGKMQTVTVKVDQPVLQEVERITDVDRLTAIADAKAELSVVKLDAISEIGVKSK